MPVRLKLDELEVVAIEASSVDAELNAELTKVSATLEEICNNVQSSELVPANQKLTSSINGVAEKVKKNLPTIIDFLNKQLKDYKQTNQSAEEKVDSLASQINTTFSK